MDQVFRHEAAFGIHTRQVPQSLDRSTLWRAPSTFTLHGCAIVFTARVKSGSCIRSSYFIPSTAALDDWELVSASATSPFRGGGFIVAVRLEFPRLSQGFEKATSASSQCVATDLPQFSCCMSTTAHVNPEAERSDTVSGLVASHIEGLRSRAKFEVNLAIALPS
jgi:hypothetical protein